jgi:flagellar basal-body rod protein FlgC
MNSLLDTMKMASAGMEVQSRRIVVTSENVSNVDTPGYKRKVLTTMAGPVAPGSFQTLMLQLDESEGVRSYEPAHPMADADGYVEGSNVSLILEMADLREANRTYEANLNTFRQAKTMYASLLDLLRR